VARPLGGYFRLVYLSFIFIVSILVVIRSLLSLGRSTPPLYRLIIKAPWGRGSPSSAPSAPHRMLHEQRFFFLASKAIVFALSRVYGWSLFTGYLTNVINPTLNRVRGRTEFESKPFLGQPVWTLLSSTCCLHFRRRTRHWPLIKPAAVTGCSLRASICFVCGNGECFWVLPLLVVHFLSSEKYIVCTHLLSQGGSLPELPWAHPLICIARRCRRSK